MDISLLHCNAHTTDFICIWFVCTLLCEEITYTLHTHNHRTAKVVLYLIAPNFCMASTRLATVAPNKSRTRTTTEGSGAVKPCVEKERQADHNGTKMPLIYKYK